MELLLALLVLSDPSLHPLTSLVAASIDKEGAFVRVGLHPKGTQHPKDVEDLGPDVVQFSLRFEDPLKVHIIGKESASIGCPARPIGRIKMLLYAPGE